MRIVYQILASAYNVRLHWKPTFFVYTGCPLKFSYHHRGRCGHYYVRQCLFKCVANHIISPHGCGQKADRCDPVPHPFLPEPVPSFPSPSFRPFAPSVPATETLMTSLTPNPSVGNYNICRHEKAAHKDGPSTGVTLPPPRLCLGLGFGGGGGQCRVVGIVWVEGEGAPTLCSKKRLPTTQTDMLTANTNIAKQMVHAYLFRLPFKCTPQLCESALSSIEGRTYQLPSSPRYKGNLSLGNNERASLVSWLRVSAAPCYISMAIHQCRTLQKW